MPKASGARPRTVVFTQGAEPTIVAVNGKVTLYPVPKVRGWGLGCWASAWVVHSVNWIFRHPVE